MLIHLHVPKCAGSTINLMIRNALGRERSLAATQADLVERYGPLGTGQLAGSGYEALFGHVVWGAHEYFGSEFTYYSAVRDPVARICSLFNYIHGRADHLQHEALGRHLRDLSDVTPATLDVIRPFRTLMRNHAAACYSGERTPERATVQRVMDHVRAGRLVVGEPREIIDLVAARLGTTEPERQNVTDLGKLPAGVVPASPATLSPRATALLRSWNEVDDKLLDRIAARRARLDAL